MTNARKATSTAKPLKARGAKKAKKSAKSKAKKTKVLKSAIKKAAPKRVAAKKAAKNSEVAAEAAAPLAFTSDECVLCKLQASAEKPAAKASGKAKAAKPAKASKVANVPKAKTNVDLLANQADSKVNVEDFSTEGCPYCATEATIKPLASKAPKAKGRKSQAAAASPLSSSDSSAAPSPKAKSVGKKAKASKKVASPKAPAASKAKGLKKLASGAKKVAAPKKAEPVVTAIEKLNALPLSVVPGLGESTLSKLYDLKSVGDVLAYSEKDLCTKYKLRPQMSARVMRSAVDTACKAL